MAETTGISWADATMNPWVGCSKVSPGCAYCYAETLVTGRMGRAGTWGEGGVRERTSAGLWRKPLRWAALARDRRLPDGSYNEDGHRPRVFCASLADVFEPREELRPWRRDLFDLITDTPELDWLVLTKRPDVAALWLRGWYEEVLSGGAFRLEGDENWAWRDGIGWGVLPNLWVGTSIENSRFTWRADSLREIPAPVRFISAEPLLGSLFLGPSGESPDAEDAPRQPDAGPIPAGSTLEDRGLPDTPGRVTGSRAAQSGAADHATGHAPDRGRSPLDLTGIDWVIVGGESGGRDARPMHPAWAREIRDVILYPWSNPHHDVIGDLLEGHLPELCRRPALHFKQWGSWVPDEFGRDPNGVWVSPDGRARSSLAADAYDDLPNGSMRMRYAGGAPKSGGKLLDGVEYCEFPEGALTPA